MFKFISTIIIFSLSLIAADSVSCKLVNQDDILKIKCKYNTIAKSYDRNISMAWKSPSFPQDDRFRTIVLPANNKSTYDFRYFDGRADGAWSISATDESTGKTATTKFIKEELKEETTESKDSK